MAMAKSTATEWVNGAIRRIRSFRFIPRTNSVTRNGAPSSSPTSYRRAMLG